MKSRKPGFTDSQDQQALWDEAAASFDDEPDHGLRQPEARAAWTALLERWLPEKPVKVLDIGCGTGSLSVVMAGLGHQVTGIDFSPAMIERAKAKAQAAGHDIPFTVMDAANPQFPPGSFNVVVCRHVLWALPETAEVLRRWAELLRKDGRLLLIEGFWETGGGLHTEEIVTALPESLSLVVIEQLSDWQDLWGKPVTDERYIIVGERG